VVHPSRHRLLQHPANGVPPALVDAVVRIESRYDPTAVGSIGEMGLMQVKSEFVTRSIKERCLTMAALFYPVRPDFRLLS
jgi:soluble lytic murein transglycosylase-like protein